MLSFVGSPDYWKFGSVVKIVIAWVESMMIPGEAVASDVLFVCCVADLRVFMCFYCAG